LAGIVAFKMGCRWSHIFLANVPRQVSLADGAGGPQSSGAKALGLLLLPAGPVPERWNVGSVFIETPDGQRLAGRARSAILLLVLYRFRSLCVDKASN
jgi:hypothetical protein